MTTPQTPLTLDEKLEMFQKHLANLRALGKLCKHCDSRLKQVDNDYCFNCMCDLEIRDMEKRNRG